MFTRRHAMLAVLTIAALTVATDTTFAQRSAPPDLPSPVRVGNGGGSSTSFVQSSASSNAPVLSYTRPAKDLQLGFTPNGMVSEVLVKEGEHVKKDDVLIRLRADDIKAARAINELNAASDLEIKAAEAELDYANNELELTQLLFDRGSTSPQELRRSKVQALIAALKVDLAKQQKEVAAKELERSDVILSYYELRSPIDGIVQRIIVSEGETVEQLKPVLRLVSIDPMEVHAQVPTRQTHKMAVGEPAWVVHQLKDFAEPMEGKIKLIDPVADSGSGTRRVVIELPNPKSIAPGVEVSVSFTKPEPLAARNAGN